MRPSQGLFMPIIPHVADISILAEEAIIPKASTEKPSRPLVWTLGCTSVV